jgi:hypothetical protein
MRNSSSRVFHQVDRGETSSQYCSSRAQKVFLAKHNLSLRRAKENNHRQCHQMGVEAAFASVYHTQSNDAVEKANPLIFSTVKKILEDQPKGKWAQELPRAIWSHNTSICRATKFTPFRLLYGEEPVTPEEIKLHSARTKAEAIYSPTKIESNDLLEPERMKAVKNL